MMEHNQENTPLIPGAPNTRVQEVDILITVDSGKQKNWAGLLLRDALMLIFAIAFSTFIICGPQFIYKRINDENKSENPNNASKCGEINGSLAENKSQKETTNWIWYFNLVQLCIALPMIILFGVYSDIIGRKYSIFISCLATSLNIGCMALVVALDLSLYYLYIGYVISGLGGSQMNFFASMSSSIADSTSASKHRTIAFALLYLSIGIGVSSSQFALGFILKYYGFVWPLAFASAITLLDAVLILVFYKDELETPESGFRHLKSKLKNAFKNKEETEGYPVWVYIVTLIALQLYFSVLDNRENIETLLQLRSPFCWDSQYIAWFQSAESAIHLLAGSSLIMVLQKWFRDEIIACAGLVSGMAFYLMFAFAVRDWMIYAGASLGILCVAVGPCLKAALSKMVPPDFQGSLFAAVYIMSVISNLAGSTVFNNIYAHTQTTMHGMTFIVMAGCNLIAVICLIAAIAFKKSDRGRWIAVQTIDVKG